MTQQCTIWVCLMGKHVKSQDSKVVYIQKMCVGLGGFDGIFFFFVSEDEGSSVLGTSTLLHGM